MNPPLHEVLDWYSHARERGETLADWQQKYPEYADSLDGFEVFVSTSEKLTEGRLREQTPN